MTLAWSAPSEEADAVTGYEILRAVGQGEQAALVSDTSSTATTYTDTTATEAGETYAYQVKAIRGEDRSQGSGQVQVHIPHDPVDLRPTGLTVRLVENKVTLSWTAPKEKAESVDGYEILRRRPSEGEGALMTLVADTESTATTYTDATANEAGVVYVYRVKALRGSEASRWSNFDRIELPADYEPDPTPTPTPEPESTSDDQAPTNLTAALAEGGGVALSWSAPAEDADSVTGYEVLRAVGQGEPVTLAADTSSTANTYTDATAAEAGETYAYAVKAIRGEDRSQASGQAQVQVPHDPVDLAPSGLTAALAEGGGVTLAWSAPSEEADAVTGYEILRTVGQGELATLVSDTGATATVYTDATATEAGETYAYQVKAIRGEERSQASGQVQVQAQVPHDPVDLAPTGLTAVIFTAVVVGEEFNAGVGLSWTAPAEDADSVTGYEILRAVGEGELVTLAADTGSTATAYTDATATTAGETYAYQVKAIRGGDQSQASDRTEVQLPHDPVDLAPSSIVASLAEDGGLTLAWTAPAEETDSVTGYQIVGAVGQGELATLADDTESTDTTYTDATATTAGETYAYQVKAVRDGILSEASARAAFALPEAIVSTCEFDAGGSDLPADTTTACVLAVDGSVRGERATADDVDWYRVGLQAGATYQIDMRGKSTGGWELVDGAPAFVSVGTLEDPRLLGIYDASGALVGGSDSELAGTGKDSRIASFSPDADGVYYIGASAESGWTGTYELSLTVTAGEHVAGPTVLEPLSTSLQKDQLDLVELSPKKEEKSDDPTDVFLPSQVFDPVLIPPGDVVVRADEETPVLLVKNTGQTASGVGDNPDSATPKLAQAFTTGGDSRGYTLSSIGILFHFIAVTSTAGAELTVTLNSDNSGNPGSLLCTLSDPTSFTSAAVNTFVAPPTGTNQCPTLEAGTTYFVVVERVIDGGTTLSWSLTQATDEDSGGAVGWSIGNDRHIFANSAWSSQSSSPYQLEVSGVVLPPEPVFPGSVLVGNTGQTSSANEGLNANFPSYAQAFSTGTVTSGYSFSSVEIRFHTIGDVATAGDELTVTLNEASGSDPGALLCTLVDPPSFSSSGGQVFTAPPTTDSDPCPALAASTTYLVVIERTNGTTDTISLIAVDATNEDSGGFAGWSLANGYRIYNGTVWSGSTYALKLQVNGEGVNHDATGQPAIRGAGHAGEPLSVDLSGIADFNGLDRESFTYQWLKVDGGDETDIEGATNRAYTPTLDDVGKRFRVKVRFTDDDGFPEGPLTSELTDAIKPYRFLLVGNTGQTSFGITSLSSTYTKAAQRFTTGASSAGYYVGSVGISFSRIGDTSTAASELTATINEADGGNPGDVLCTLDDPSSYAALSVNDFTAPASCVLAASTTYYVVLERTTTNTDIIEWRRTGASAEDSGGAPGWTIVDIGHFFPSGSWTTSGDNYHKIQVRGRPVSNSPAEGAPSIKGRLAARNEPLTAETLGISDPDGIPADVSFSYEWIVFDPDTGIESISSRRKTTETIRLQVNEHFLALKVKVTFTDAAGFTESLTSARTDRVIGDPAPRELLWVGTLGYADQGSSEYGLRSGSGDLAPDVFGYGTQPFDILSLYYSTAAEELVLELSPPPEVEDEAAWILQVYGTDYALADASTATIASPAGTRYTWPILSAHTANIGYQAGAKVRVMLNEVINSRATGTPTYSGGQFVGDALTADPSGIEDLNGIPADVEFSYQWSRQFLGSGTRTDIPGATGRTYELTDDDAGAYIFVTASFRDIKGYLESRRSSVTRLDNRILVIKPRDFLVGNAHRYHGLDGVGLTLNAGTPRRAQRFTTGEHDVGYALSQIGIRFREIENREFGPGSVVVSNAGHDASLFVEQNLSQAFPKYAQAFTTGATTGGYTLSSIGVYFEELSDTSTAGGELTVTLNADDNGNPGNAHCTLSDPASFTENAVNTFNAPLTGTDRCPTLAANTTYFVVVERTMIDTSIIKMSFVASRSEDSGGATGWSIGDGRHYLESGEPWNSFSSDPWLLEVSIAGARTTVADNLTASIVPEGGDSLPNLGSTHCTLTAPSTLIERRVNYFDASGCRALRADTNYFVVLTRTDHRGGTIEWDLAGADPLDSGSAADWSIDGRHMSCSTCTEVWSIQSPSALMITVRGEPGVSNATGAPIIRGKGYSDQTLTADVSGIDDPEGLPAATTFKYQWIRVDGATETETEIDGATSQTYRTTDDEVGQDLKVRVSFTDNAGFLDGVDSSPRGILEGFRDSTTFLVSNLRQAPGGSYSVTEGDRGYFQYAQRFTTGGRSGGYDAGFVDIRLSRAYPVGTAARYLKVGIYEESSGDPADLVCTLVNPKFLMLSGVTRFTPDASGCHLARNTTYFVRLVWTGHPHLESSTDHEHGAFITWTFTASGSEDAGSAAGWSIFGETRRQGGTNNLDQRRTNWGRGAFGAFMFMISEDANRRPSGRPRIAGAPHVNETLKANVGGISDPDGTPLAGAFSYYWVRVDGDQEWAIPGATGRTYRLTPEDAGMRVKVRVWYRDQAGRREGLESRPTSAIKTTPAPRSGTEPERTIWSATLTVGGSLDTTSVPRKVGYGPDPGGALSEIQFFYRGETYTVDHLTWEVGADDVRTSSVSVGLSPEPDVDVAAYGEGGTWRLLTPDGEQERFERVQDGALHTVLESPTSASPVGSEVDVALKVLNPQTTFVLNVSVRSPAQGAPRISGTLQVGETLSADISGITDRDGLPDTFDYQWVLVEEEDETDIVGATDQTYVPRFEERGKQLKVRVSFTDNNDNLDGPLTSSASDEITFQTATLVSNSIFSTSITGGIISSSPRAAQGFRTGANGGGYDLDSVAIRIHMSGGVPTKELAVTINQANGSEPGIVHCPLVNPRTFSDGTDHQYTFAATSGCVLAASTNYYIVVVRQNLDTSGVIRMRDTTTNGQVTGVGGDGWSIHDSGFGPSSSSSWSSSSDALSVEISGGAIPGIPTISGTAEVGETLTADISPISDTDGLPATFDYQWVRLDGAYESEIDGATDQTYTTTFQDMGRRVKVKVSYTDNADNFEGPLVSEPTGQIRGPVLVKNTGQAVLRTSGEELYDDFPAWAQGFLTGGHGPGYALDAIGIEFGRIDDLSNVGSQLHVEVREQVVDSGSVGSPLCTLVGPPSYAANSVNYFTAPVTGCTLAANRDHFVVVTRVTFDSNQVRILQTVADAEDAGGAVGWTISDNSFYFSAADADWQGSVASNMIDVRGAPRGNSAGRPTISGDAFVGETLTADISGITDADGLPDTFEYQWVRVAGDVDTVIPGARAQSYTLTTADAGKQIKVAVRFIDGADNYEGPLSAATELVGFSPPTIVGAPIVGQTLSVDTSTMSHPDGINSSTFSYQWESVPGAPETHFGPEGVLVKNTGQVIRGSAELITGSTRAAQPFTTGGNSGGYRMSSIGIHFAVIGDSATAGGQLRVSLNEVRRDGNPGSAALCTLNNPTTSIASTTLGIFDAPASGTDRCPRLAANTTYFVVIERVSVTADALEMLVTASVAEDAGGAAAWRIGDNHHSFDGLGNVWDSSGHPLLIEVSAAAALGVESLRGATDRTYTVRSSDFGKRLQVRVEYRDNRGNEVGPVPSESTGVVGSAAVSDPVVSGPRPDNLPATGKPTISGRPFLGETLTAQVSGIIDPNEGTNQARIEATASYQWIRVDGTDETDIDGATGQTYTLTADDLDKQVRVRVSFVDAAGYLELPNDSDAISLARSSPRLLVKNTSRTRISVAGSPQLSTTNEKYASEFVTGNNAGGYTLTSVRIRFAAYDSAESVASQVRVTVHAHSGTYSYLGTRICTLVGPSAADVGSLSTYYAPAEGCTLLPHGAYDIVVERVNATSDIIRLSLTEKFGEDAGSASGWIINNPFTGDERDKNYDFRVFSNGVWTEGTPDADDRSLARTLVFDIRGLLVEAE